MRGVYSNLEDKLAGAREHKRLEALPSTVLVDDYAGTVHREWGREMADPTYGSMPTDASPSRFAASVG